MISYRELVIADGPTFYARLGEATGSALNEIGGTGAQAPPAGTYNGAPLRAQPGRIGHSADGCVRLSGTGQWVSFPDNANVDLGDLFTIEFWCRRVGAWGVQKTLIDKGTGAYAVYFNAANKLIVQKRGTGIVYTSTAAFSTTGWLHIVVTKSGPSSIGVYVNGVAQPGTTAAQTMTDNATGLLIGAAAGPSEGWPGDIDEVAFYKKILTGGQVTAHYNAALTMNALPDRVLEIALESNPLDAAPKWRNYTEYLLAGSGSRGKAEELERTEAGTASITLLNTDSRFDPFNTSSPYNGTLKPSKPIRFSIDWYGTRHTLWTGTLESWPPHWTVGPYSEVTVNASDALAILAQATFPGPGPATLMATWSNGTPQTFTDGSAFTAPDYARNIWAEISADWWGDDSTSLRFRYANQDGSTTIAGGGLRQVSAEIPVGANVAAGTRYDLALIDGDIGVRDITAGLSSSINQGQVKVYGQKETFPHQMSGLMVSAMLDAIGWPAGASWRNIAPGATGGAGWSDIQGWTPAIDETALGRFQLIADTEIGQFFIDRLGRATFHDRHSRWAGATASIAAYYGDSSAAAEIPYIDLVPEGEDVKRVKNDIRIQADGQPAPAPAQIDTASITAYGRRLYAVSLPFYDKTEPARMAIQIKTWFSQPTPRFTALTVVPRPAGDPKARMTLEQTAPRELGDRIQVLRQPPGGTKITKTCRIESIAWSTTPESFSMTFQLSPDVTNPWY